MNWFINWTEFVINSDVLIDFPVMNILVSDEIKVDRLLKRLQSNSGLLIFRMKSNDETQQQQEYLNTSVLDHGHSAL